VVHSARQVENPGVGLLQSSLRDLCGSSTFPALQRRSIGGRPSGSRLRSLAEKADYVILIQENT